MATRRTNDKDDAVRTAKILGVIEELRFKLDELERLVTGAEQTEPGFEELASRERKLTSRQAAEILEIHATNVSRLAQLDLILHSRIRAPGGGSTGQYRFSAAELLEVKPQIRELVSKARKMLTVSPDEYASVSEAVEITGLQARVIVRLAMNNRIAYVAPDPDNITYEDASSGRLQVNLKDLVDLMKEASRDQVALSAVATGD